MAISPAGQTRRYVSRHDAWGHLRQLLQEWWRLSDRRPVAARAVRHRLDRAAVLLQLRADAVVRGTEPGCSERSVRQTHLASAVVVPVGRHVDVPVRSVDAWHLLIGHTGGSEQLRRPD